MRRLAIVALLVFSINCDASAKEIDIFEMETEGSYIMETGSPVELSKKVAFFIAKKTAVELAGRYFSHKHLIKTYELNQEEIYSLTAREIQAEILEEKRETVGTAVTYRLRVRTHIQASDFIKAEIEDARLAKEEENEPYSEKMKQHVSAEIDPGKDIAKAYRLLREKKWRITIIYLDHLEEKYPNWDSIYMLKAIIYYIFHEPVFMKKALSEACRLGNNTACDDLKNIKTLHEHVF